MLTVNRLKLQPWIQLVVAVAVLFAGIVEADQADFKKADLPEGARVSERVFGLRGLSNVGRVDAGIYRGAQPAPEGYLTLKEMGIRTVINLRSRHSEKEEVEAAGMRSVEIPMNIFDVREETVRQVVAVMSDPANRPVYIHCKLGKDRTGVVVAIYRMEMNGWALSEAEAEMQAFGFNDIWFNLKDLVRHYRLNTGERQ